LCPNVKSGAVPPGDGREGQLLRERRRLGLHLPSSIFSPLAYPNCIQRCPQLAIHLLLSGNGKMFISVCTMSQYLKVWLKLVQSATSQRQRVYAHCLLTMFHLLRVDKLHREQKRIWKHTIWKGQSWESANTPL